MTEQANMETKLIKMCTGEDLIAMVSFSNDQTNYVSLLHPMLIKTFFSDDGQIRVMLYPWIIHQDTLLPDVVVINQHHVIYIRELDTDILSYYTNYIKESIKKKQSPNTKTEVMH